jgi:V8-like Glu-specific endopeptidase
MKKITLLSAVSFLILISCGPSKAELEAKEEAKQDSLAEVAKADSIAKATKVSEMADNAVYTYCIDSNRCGPWDLIKDVTKIVGAETQKTPYLNILHIETHRNKIVKRVTDYGTVSFISENTLITAKHVVSDKAILNKIGLSLSTEGKDDWIYFDRTEFEITYYNKKSNVETDIAVVKLLNKQKLSQLYKGHFSVENIGNKLFTKNDKVNLTGYPCYFANTPGGHDTLVTKSTTIDKLNLSKSSFIAYHFFTCIGDSGDPLWIEKDGKYYIAGIHHGGGDDGGFDDSYNFSVRITDDINAWLKEMISK